MHTSMNNITESCLGCKLQNHSVVVQHLKAEMYITWHRKTYKHFTIKRSYKHWMQIRLYQHSTNCEHSL